MSKMNKDQEEDQVTAGQETSEDGEETEWLFPERRKGEEDRVLVLWGAIE